MVNKNDSFRFPVRVYIEDTDIGGIVFYANYLKYFERARTEYIRSLGFELRSDFESGVSYVVHSLDARYHKPAKLDEKLNVTASIRKLGRSYIDFYQRVERFSGELLVEGNVKVVCVSTLKGGQPCPLPDGLTAVLKINSQ